MAKIVRNAILLALPFAVVIGCGDKAKLIETEAGLAVKPVTLSFGKVFVGEHFVHRVEVENTGVAAALTVDATEAPSDFTLEPASFTVAPGGKQIVEVAFRPEEAGLVEGAILFRAAAGDLTAQVAVEGTGVVRKVRAEEAIDFGGVKLGESRTLPLVFSSATAAPLEIAIETPPDRAFIAAPHTHRLEPDATLEVAVTFSPQLRGPVESAIAFRVCRECEREWVALIGQGLQAELTATPDPVGFEPVALGLTRRQVVAIANTGDLDLDLSSVQVHGEAFAISRETSLHHLPVGSETDLEISFTPLAEGVHQGTLQIDGTTEGAEVERLLSVRVFGHTGGPLLVASPSQLDFGPLYVGLAPLRQTVTLTNVGDPAPISLLSASIEDDDGAAFTVEYEPTVPIEPSTSVTVKFDPNDEGQYPARLVLRTDAVGQEEISVALEGYASMPSPCTLAISGSGNSGHQIHLIPEQTIYPDNLTILCHSPGHDWPCGPCVFSNPRIEGPDARFFQLRGFYRTEDSYSEASLPFLFFGNGYFLHSYGLAAHIAMAPDSPREVLHADFLYDVNGITRDFYIFIDLRSLP